MSMKGGGVVFKGKQVPSALAFQKTFQKKCLYINHIILKIMMVVNNFCAVGTVWTGVCLVGTKWTDVRTVTTEWTDFAGS